VGAGSEEGAGEETTESLISDIQAGLEAFPEATENLSTAATALKAAAQALSDAAGTGQIQDGIYRASH
jgi:hypothetical protein